MAKKDKSVTSITDRLKRAGALPIKYTTGIGKAVLMGGGKEYFLQELPTIQSMYDVNKDILKDTITFIRNPSNVIKKQIQIAMQTDVWKGTEQIVGYMIDDLKTGNFYDPERMRGSAFGDIDTGSDDDFGGFDMSGFDENGDWSEPESSSSGDDSGFDDSAFELDLAEAQDEQEGKRTQATIGAIGTAAEAMIDNDNKNAERSVTMKIRENAQTMAAFQNLITVNSAIHESISNSATVTTELTREIGNQVIDKLDNIRSLLDDNIGGVKDILVEIKDSVAIKPQEQDNYQKKLPFNERTGTIDIKAWIKNAGKQFLDQSGLGMMTSMLPSAKELIDMFSADPWTTILGQNLFRKLMPDTFTPTVKAFNEHVQGFFPALTARLAEIGEKDDDNMNPIVKQLAMAFGIKPRSFAYVDTNVVGPDEPARFTNKIAKAITDVIPNLLAQLVSLQSGERIKIFNYHTGKFEDSAEIIARTEYSSKDLAGKMRSTSYAKDLAKAAIEFKNSDEEEATMDYIHKAFQSFAESNVVPNPYLTPKELKAIFPYGSDAQRNMLSSILRAMPAEQLMNIPREIASAHRSRDSSVASMTKNLAATSQIMAYAGGLDSGMYDTIGSEARGAASQQLNLKKINELSDEYRKDMYREKGVLTPSALLNDIRNSLISGIITFSFNAGKMSKKNADQVLRDVLGENAGTILSANRERILTTMKHDLYTKEEIDARKSQEERRKQEYKNAQKKEYDKKIADPLHDKVSLSDLKVNPYAENVFQKVQFKNMSEEQLKGNVFYQNYKKALGELTDTASDVAEKIGIKAIFATVQDLVHSPFKLVERSMQFMDATMFRLIYGEEATVGMLDDQPYLLGTITNVLKGNLNKLGDWFTKTFDRLKKNLFSPNGLFGRIGTRLGEMIKPVVDRTGGKIKDIGGKIVDKTIGTKGEDGKRTGGKFSDTANKVTDKTKDMTGNLDAKISEAFGRLMYGTGNTRYSHGKSKTVDDLIYDENGHYVGRETYTEYGGVIGAFRKSFDGLREFLFGPEDEETESKKKLRQVQDALKGTLPDALIGAGLGAAGTAGVGFLTSLWLPGGPIVGAMLGAGAGIVNSSETLKKYLFGKIGEDGEREGGLIDKEVQQFFKKFMPKTIIGGLGGALLGNMGLLPFGMGPMVGMIMGSMGGMIASSDRLRMAIFGDGEDPDSGFLSKNTKSKIMKALPTTILGGVGGMVAWNMISNLGLIPGLAMLPGGPILGAFGAVAGALSADAIHDFLFGEEHEETTETKDGKKVTKKVREGGVFGRMFDFTKNKVFEPFARGMNKVGHSIMRWFNDDVAAPFEQALQPMKNAMAEAGEHIKDAFRGLVDNVKAGIDAVFDKAFGIPLKQFMKENVFDPLNGMVKKLFGFVGKVIGGILSAPFKALNFMFTGQAAAKGQDFISPIAGMSKDKGESTSDKAKDQAEQGSKTIEEAMWDLYGRENEEEEKPKKVNKNDEKKDEEDTEAQKAVKAQIRAEARKKQEEAQENFEDAMMSTYGGEGDEEEDQKAPKKKKRKKRKKRSNKVTDKAKNQAESKQQDQDEEEEQPTPAPDDKRGKKGKVSSKAKNTPPQNPPGPDTKAEDDIQTVVNDQQTKTTQDKKQEPLKQEKKDKEVSKKAKKRAEKEQNKARKNFEDIMQDMYGEGDDESSNKKEETKPEKTSDKVKSTPPQNPPGPVVSPSSKDDKKESKPDAKSSQSTSQSAKDRADKAAKDKESTKEANKKNGKTGNLITDTFKQSLPENVDNIKKDVGTIATEVKDQLGGSGWNLNKIRLILTAAFGDAADDGKGGKAKRRYSGGGGFGGVVSGLFDLITRPFKMLGSILTGTVNGIGSLITDTGKMLLGIPKVIGQVIGALGSGFVAIVKSLSWVPDAVGKVAKAIGDTAVWFGKGLFNVTKKVLGAIIPAVWDSAKTVVPGLTKMVGTLLGGVFGTVGKALGAAVGAGSGMFASISKFIGDWREKRKGKKGIFDRVREAFGGKKKNAIVIDKPVPAYLAKDEHSETAIKFHDQEGFFRSIPIAMGKAVVEPDWAIPVYVVGTRPADLPKDDKDKDKKTDKKKDPDAKKADEKSVSEKAKEAADAANGSDDQNGTPPDDGSTQNQGDQPQQDGQHGQPTPKQSPFAKMTSELKSIWSNTFKKKSDDKTKAEKYRKRYEDVNRKMDQADTAEERKSVIDKAIESSEDMTEIEATNAIVPNDEVAGDSGDLLGEGGGEKKKGLLGKIFGLLGSGFLSIMTKSPLGKILGLGKGVAGKAGGLLSKIAGSKFGQVTGGVMKGGMAAAGEIMGGAANLYNIFGEGGNTLWGLENMGRSAASLGKVIAGNADEIADAGPIKKAIGKLVNKLLNSKVVQNMFGSLKKKIPQVSATLTKKLSGTVLDRAMKSGAANTLKSAGRQIAAFASAGTLSIAFAIADFVSGFGNAKKYFNVFGSDVTLGMKLTSAIVNTLGGLLGLIPGVGPMLSVAAAMMQDDIVQTIYGLLASDADKEELAKDQQKLQAATDKYNAENGTNLTVDEYSKKFNEDGTKATGFLGKVGKVAKGIVSLPGKAVKAVGVVANKAVELGGKAVNWVGDKVSKVGNWVGDVTNMLGDKFINFAENAPEIITKAINTVIEKLSNVMVELPTTIGKFLGDGIGNLIRARGGITQIALDMGTGIIKFLAGDSETGKDGFILKIAQGLGKMLLAGVKLIFRTPEILGRLALGIGKGVITGAQAFAGGIKGFVWELGKGIGEGIKDAVLGIKDSAVELVNTTIEGGKNMINSAVSGISNTWNSLSQSAASLFGGNKPKEYVGFGTGPMDDYKQMKENSESAQKGSKKGSSFGLHSLLEVGSGVGESIVGMIKEAFPTGDLLSAIFEAVGRGVGTTFAGVIQEESGSKKNSMSKLISTTTAQTQAEIAVEKEKKEEKLPWYKKMLPWNWGKGKSASEDDKYVDIEIPSDFGKGPMKTFDQTDPKWGGKEGTNIADKGCGPTAAAMAVSAYGKKSSPVEADRLSYNTGMRASDGGTNPDFFSKYGASKGVEMRSGPTDPDTITKAASSNKPVVVMGKGGPFGTGTHYMVANGGDGKSRVNIVDPLGGKQKQINASELAKNTKNAVYSFGKGKTDELVPISIRDLGKGPESENSEQSTDETATPTAAPMAKNGYASTAALRETATPQATSAADLFVAVAEGEVGYVEKASNSDLDNKTANPGSANYTKYGKFAGCNGAPWCAAFVSWCANQVGILGTLVPKFTSCQAAVDWYSNKGWYKPASSGYKPMKGDLIFFKGGYFGSGHVGIVAASDDKYIYTIEGNTSADSNGSQNNGGCVAKKKRPYNIPGIRGFAVVNYGGTRSAGIPGTQVAGGSSSSTFSSGSSSGSYSSSSTSGSSGSSAAGGLLGYINEAYSKVISPFSKLSEHISAGLAKVLAPLTGGSTDSSGEAGDTTYSPSTAMSSSSDGSATSGSAASSVTKGTDGKYSYNTPSSMENMSPSAIKAMEARGELKGGSSFNKYELSDSDKEKIAALLTRENIDTPKGMKYGASHMANLVESKYGQDATRDELFKKLNSGWYGKNPFYCKWPTTDNARQAVEDVLVQGKRVLPRYVVEYDMFPKDAAIEGAWSESVKSQDLSKYIPHKTIIKQDPSRFKGGGVSYKMYDIVSDGVNANVYGYFDKNFEQYKTDVPWGTGKNLGFDPSSIESNYGTGTTFANEETVKYNKQIKTAREEAGMDASLERAVENLTNSIQKNVSKSNDVTSNESTTNDAMIQVLGQMLTVLQTIAKNTSQTPTINIEESGHGKRVRNVMVDSHTNRITNARDVGAYTIDRMTTRN